MRFLYYGTLIAAFTIGMTTSTVAEAFSHNNTAIHMNGGMVDVTYNEASETIELRMVSEGKAERIMVVLAGRGGAIVYKQKVVVSNHGTILEIPMTELTDGNYFLRIKGSALNYSGRFRKK